MSDLASGTFRLHSSGLNSPRESAHVLENSSHSFNIILLHATMLISKHMNLILDVRASKEFKLKLTFILKSSLYFKVFFVFLKLGLSRYLLSLLSNH